MSEREDTWPSRVAIVGAGTMGVGISQVFASSGIPTVLIDTTAARADSARERALQLLSRLEASGNVDEGAAETAQRHLSTAASLEAGVRGADLIVEGVVERSEVKTAVYAALEVAVGDHAVIATNTSSIPIADLAAGLQATGPVPGGALVRAATPRPVCRGDPRCARPTSRSSTRYFEH